MRHDTSTLLTRKRLQFLALFPMPEELFRHREHLLTLLAFLRELVAVELVRIPLLPPTISAGAVATGERFAPLLVIRPGIRVYLAEVVSGLLVQFPG